MMKILKRGKLLVFCALLCLLLTTVASAAGSGDVASAVESTWTTASTQIKTVVDNVVFPVIDMVLAIAFFVKLGTHTLTIGNPGSLNGLPQPSSLPAWSLR